MELTELVKLSSALLTFAGIVIGFMKVQNVKNNRKINTVIKEAVKDEIKGFGIKLDFLYDTHKDRPKLAVIMRKLEEIIDTLAEDGNKEIHRILLNGLEKINPVFENIFESRFTEIKKDKIINILKRKASFLRQNIDFNALFGKERDVMVDYNFIELIKIEVLPEIKMFAANLEEISREKTNGERIKSFEEISKVLITNVTNKTIKIYSDIKEKSVL